MHIDHIAFHTLKILIHLPLKPRLTILRVDFPKLNVIIYHRILGYGWGKGEPWLRGGGEEGRVDPCANPLIYCIQWLFLIILVFQQLLILCVAFFSICFLLVFHQLSIILVFFNSLEHIKLKLVFKLNNLFAYLEPHTLADRVSVFFLYFSFDRHSQSLWL